MPDTEGNRMFDLVGELQALCDECVPIFPGRSVVDFKKLYRIAQDFPESIDNQITDARIILRKKDEILQEAKLRAERIIQDAENERYKLLNESSLNKAMEEHAEKFRQAVFEECQQMRAAALSEAQEIRMSARNDSMRMKEDSQEYAQQLLNNLEQDLNRLYQVVKNGQTSLQEMRAADSMQHMRENQ